MNRLFRLKLAMSSGLMLLWFLASALGGQVLPPGFDARVQVDPPKATVGDPIRIDFLFTLPAGSRLTVPNLDPQLGEFTVLEKYPGPTVPGAADSAADSRHHRVRVVAAVYKTGEFAFPPIAFVLRDASGNEIPAPSASIKIRIDSVLAQGDNGLKDLKRQVEITEPSRWLLWTALTLAAILAAALVFRWMRGRRRPGVAAAVRVVEADPLDVAEAEFRDLLGRGLLEKGMVKQFYVGISDIIKRALEAGCRVPTLEQTTAEIMEAFSRAPVRLETAGLDQIEAFLVSCDMVKFARYAPSAGETEQCIRQAERILAECRVQRRLQSAPAQVAEGA